MNMNSNNRDNVLIEYLIGLIPESKRISTNCFECLEDSTSEHLMIKCQINDSPQVHFLTCEIKNLEEDFLRRWSEVYFMETGEDPFV